MADINVNVVLPDPINVDVTSPTQAFNTNVYIPGPQGPTGPRGAGSNINGLTPDFLYITGRDGIIVLSNGVDIIYISGNSGYFQSAINATGNILDNKINSLSGYVTGISISLPTTIVYTTGDQTISGIKTFTSRPTVNATGIVLSGETVNYATNAGTSSYASNAGSSATSSYATNAGSSATSSYATNAGYVVNAVYITGTQTISGNKDFTSRPTVNGTGVLLSGEAASLPNTIVYTTGTQTISGSKTFTANTAISGNLIITGNLTVTGSGVFNSVSIVTQNFYTGNNILKVYQYYNTGTNSLDTVFV